MNIFVLSLNPEEAAQAMCDKHVPKMVLETAQLLCSPFEAPAVPYRRTHFNHPCTKWVRASLDNYLWLCDYGITLAEEYTFRYGRRHKSQDAVEWCSKHLPNLSMDGITQFAQAMPQRYKDRNPVKAYRNYYLGEKARFAKWERGRLAPAWWKGRKL